MDSRKIEEILEKKGVRVTSIRILVMDALMSASRPMSLSDLETVLDNDGNVILTEGLVLQDKNIWKDFLRSNLRCAKERKNAQSPTCTLISTAKNVTRPSVLKK